MRLIVLGLCGDWKWSMIICVYDTLLVYRDSEEDKLCWGDNLLLSSSRDSLFRVLLRGCEPCPLRILSTIIDYYDCRCG